MAEVVTENPCEHGGGLMDGGPVLYECPMFSVGKREGQTGVFRERLPGDSLVRDLTGSVSVVRCFVDGHVWTSHPCFNINVSAEKSL